MTPSDFVTANLATAQAVKAGTGLDETTLLAQWALETAWATSWAGAPYNLGNIRDTPSSFAQYGSLAEFADAAIWTFHNARPNIALPVSESNNYYWPVLATAGQSIEAQLAALGASAWDADHYGSPPGSALIPYAEEIDMFSDYDRHLLERVFNLEMTGCFATDPTGAPLPGSVGYVRGVVAPAIQSAIAAIKAIPPGSLSPAQDAELTEAVSRLRALKLVTV